MARTYISFFGPIEQPDLLKVMKLTEGPAAQISTSNLPQLDWGQPSPGTATSGSLGAQPTTMPADLLSGSYPVEPRAVSQAASVGSGNVASQERGRENLLHAAYGKHVS